MDSLFLSALTQTLTFLPLALGISISYCALRATDMTLDGSFVLGAAIFAKCVTLGFSPYLAAIASIGAGALSGFMVSCIQRKGKIDPLLAGILASFILTSGNLILMGRPNINLLEQHTLLSAAFQQGPFVGWMQTAFYVFLLCFAACYLMQSPLGLRLRAFGNNPQLLARLGRSIEAHRMIGFSLTNSLAAASGMLTAQVVGYADTGMGLGMTLTGIGAIILGQQFIRFCFRKSDMRIGTEFVACLIGVMCYFFAMNGLLRLDINPIFLRMLLGVVLILFLRAAATPQLSRETP
ncbi:MAG: ABC transporter permease [Gammaproteobacteria bacterium]|nr:ABC transporter permease [Gammaproteobacteria bacterium]